MLARHRASVVCMDAGALLCVRLRDPVSGVVGLYPPGGGIEPAETPAQAAVREAREETGYDVTLVPESEHVARYPYTWAGKLRDVTTWFYAATLARGRAAQGPYEDDGITLGVEWVERAAIEDALGARAPYLGAVMHVVGFLEHAARGASA